MPDGSYVRLRTDRSVRFLMPLAVSLSLHLQVQVARLQVRGWMALVWAGRMARGRWNVPVWAGRFPLERTGRTCDGVIMYVVVSSKGAPIAMAIQVAKSSFVDSLGHTRTSFAAQFERAK